MYKVWLPYSKCPDGALITKSIGGRVYTLRSSITIYPSIKEENVEPTVIKAPLGYRFILRSDSPQNINCVMNTECCFRELTREELLSLLESDDEI